MDKQKQIEEMRGVIKHYAINQHCNKENIYKSHLITSDSKGIATALYNAGYRKIPENAVVLTRDEYERLKGFSREEVDEILETAKKNLRKETAEKFADRLKYYIESNEVQTTLFGNKCFIDKETVDEIAKEFTEGE